MVLISSSFTSVLKWVRTEPYRTDWEKDIVTDLVVRTQLKRQTKLIFLIWKLQQNYNTCPYWQVGVMLHVLIERWGILPCTYVLILCSSLTHCPRGDSTVRRAVSSEGEREGSPWRDGVWLVAVVLSDSNRWPAGGRCRPMTLCVSVCRGECCNRLENNFCSL